MYAISKTSRGGAFVDIHCHLVPGIDDGAKSYDDSLQMARLAVAEGIGTIIATPHQLGAFGENRGALIRARVTELQQRLDDEDIPLRVLPGADVRIEVDLVKKIRDGDVLTLADRGKHVLLELPHELYFPLEPVLDQLAKAGLVGILSHPERNQGLLQQWRLTANLVNHGCLMQVTSGSLVGSFGPRSQEMAEWMVAEGLVHFLATDAHGPKSRRPLIRRAYEHAATLAGPDLANQMTRDNPAAVACGKDVRSGRSHVGCRRRTRFGWLKPRKAA